MKKIIVAILFLFSAFLLQATFFAQFKIGGIIPNLLLIVTASIGFLEGRRAGLYVGFFAGMLLDVFFGSLYGVNAMLFMWIGYLNGNLMKVLYSKDMKTPLLLIALSNVLYNVMYCFCHFVLNGKFDFGYYIWKIIVPEMIYTTIVAIVLYPFIHFCFKKIEDLENKGEQSVV